MGTDFERWLESVKDPDGSCEPLQKKVMGGASDAPNFSLLEQGQQQYIKKKIKGVLVDALGVDDDEVTEGATLMDDLGAESIDFLDVIFRMEKGLGIRIERDDIGLMGLIGDGRKMKYEDALQIVTEKYGTLSPESADIVALELQKGNVVSMGQYFTVGSILNYCAGRIGEIVKDKNYLSRGAGE